MLLTALFNPDIFQLVEIPFYVSYYPARYRIINIINYNNNNNYYYYNYLLLLLILFKLTSKAIYVVVAYTPSNGRNFTEGFFKMVGNLVRSLHNE